MIKAHLTDAEIQRYVTEPQAISQQMANHIQGCAICQAKAANYVQLFNNIKAAAKPAFDFDLSALVMEQLPAPKRMFPWAAIVVSVFSVAIVAVSAIFFWSAIAVSVTAVSGVLLTIAAAGALTILIFQVVEMFKEHQKMIDTILSQKILQL
ncbi:MAG: hypothetical protein ABIN67_21665 [Ferruginibacter sp.]